MLEKILTIVAKVTFWSMIVLGTVLMLNFITGLVTVGLQLPLLTDIINIVQIWLPFDINVILAWLFTASGLFITFRLALLGLNLINQLIGD